MPRPAAPAEARRLGIALALPLVLGAAAVAFGPGWLRVTVYFHLTNYAALTLAAFGAAVWGFAAATRGARHGAWYAAGAAPLLLAWLSLAAVHPLFRTLLLAAGFALAFAVDARAVKAGIAPPWYLRMRKPFTAAALVALGSLAVTAA